MNAIIGMSHLTLRTELNPRQRDYLRKIQLSGQHLLGIINDILDFSKIEAGKLSVENINFDLEKVLENVSNLISEKASAKGLELIFDIDSAVPRQLKGDPLRLGQILINFCNNAVKFTESGEVVVKARVEQKDTDGQLVRFSRQRYGDRAYRRADGPTVPGVRAGGHLHHTPTWWHWTGTGYFETTRTIDGRRRWRQQRTGQRKHVLVYGAVGQWRRKLAGALPSRTFAADGF